MLLNTIGTTGKPLIFQHHRGFKIPRGLCQPDYQNLCTASTGEQRFMSVFKTQTELRLKPLVFDFVYRISCVSSAYVLKSDMDRLDAVLENIDYLVFFSRSGDP